MTTTWPDSDVQQVTPAWQDTARPHAERVELLLAEMTLEEKVAQHNGGTSNLEPTPLFPFSHGRSYTEFVRQVGPERRPVTPVNVRLVTPEADRPGQRDVEA